MPGTMEKDAGHKVRTPLVAELISVEVERWPVAGAFTISRGAKTHVDVVVCTVGEGVCRGRGEATPIYYHGETAEGCVEAIRSFARGAGTGGFSRQALQQAMPRGAARNALDCALWDLEAKSTGVPVWRLAGLPEPAPLPTAFTISLGDSARMEQDARKAAARGFRLLKCKLGGEGDIARIAAVRQGAPDVRLIVDANEGWDGEDVTLQVERLAALGVEMIEQPVARGHEAALESVVAPVPFCADESCQDRADLPRLSGFAAINIKLDKAGGLTEAIALAEAAAVSEKRLMLGCMLSTSLGIAPAFLLGPRAEWVDLDGALLLANDRHGGLELRDGLLQPGDLWGCPQA